MGTGNLADVMQQGRDQQQVGALYIGHESGRLHHSLDQVPINCVSVNRVALWSAPDLRPLWHP